MPLLGTGTQSSYIGSAWLTGVDVFVATGTGGSVDLAECITPWAVATDISEFEVDVCMGGSVCTSACMGDCVFVCLSDCAVVGS